MHNPIQWKEFMNAPKRKSTQARLKDVHKVLNNRT